MQLEYFGFRMSGGSSVVLILKRGGSYVVFVPYKARQTEKVIASMTVHGHIQTCNIADRQDGMSRKYILDKELKLWVLSGSRSSCEQAPCCIKSDVITKRCVSH